MIANTLFREKFYELEKKEELTLAEVAYRIGWVTTPKGGAPKPDSSRVARTLGMVKENGKVRASISEENAIKLCDALHVDYTEVGI